MNDDSTILITKNIKDVIRMSSVDAASSVISDTVNNNIERLEEHIDFLHTKISEMEDRIVMLESIVLNKD